MSKVRTSQVKPRHSISKAKALHAQLFAKQKGLLPLATASLSSRSTRTHALLNSATRPFSSTCDQHLMLTNGRGTRRARPKSTAEPYQRVALNGLNITEPACQPKGLAPQPLSLSPTSHGSTSHCQVPLPKPGDLVWD